MAKGFLYELTLLINKHSRENDSDTPDYILAQYIDICLEAFTMATRQRDKWYGERQGVPVDITLKEGI